ncbi:MAG: OmpA family protein, partial [Prosthecobacter sp.]|nr:OmpA family protein [Prosthecobacter sp.]
MRLSLFLLITTGLWAQQPPATSPEAAQAQARMKAAFAAQPRTRSLRAGSEPAPQPELRTGVVIRKRGPVPTLLPASEAAAADAQGALPPPPAIEAHQVDATTTGTDEVRVDASQTAAFEEILFELNSATVTLKSREVLRGIALALKEMPDRKFLVEGHTCDLGDARDPAHNLRLSCLRAEAVCAWLVHYGVPPRQVPPMG